MISRRSYFCFVAFVALSICGCEHASRQGVGETIVVDDLFESSGYQELDRRELDRFLATSTKLLMVEFGVSSGCQRCDAMNSVVRGVAAEFDGQAEVFRMDFRENSDLVAQLQLGICPSYAFFKDGQLVDRCVGVTDEGFLSSKIASLLNESTEDEG